ncbi:hypothetical protein BHE74_00020326 [Ensete ventricosum]|nr:hypothetical protein BHE74_00020326 [Ensete ventricosum]
MDITPMDIINSERLHTKDNGPLQTEVPTRVAPAGTSPAGRGTAHKGYRLQGQPLIGAAANRGSTHKGGAHEGDCPRVMAVTRGQGQPLPARRR